MTTSCQPSPQPHASGIAAMSASMGMATMTAMRVFSTGPLGVSRKSFSGAFGSAAPAGSDVAELVSMVPWFVVSETVVMGSSPGTLAGCLRRKRSAVPWARVMQIRLRNRNLRDRRLHCQQAKMCQQHGELMWGCVFCDLPTPVDAMPAIAAGPFCQSLDLLFEYDE